jgi:hydrogenase expression/formation protein HypC
MCLAVPMKLVKIEGRLGTVELDGVSLTVGLDLLEDVQVGEYLIVHAGYAIEKLDREEAEKIIALFRQLGDEETP